MPINLYNLSNVIKELEDRQKQLQSEMMQFHTDRKEMKALLKELASTNNLLKNIIDYKQNYIDEQPVKPTKEPKEPKEKKKKSVESTVSYGIRGMINK